MENTMALLLVLVTVSINALFFKVAVWAFAPNCPNSLLRAAITGAVAGAAAIGTFFLFGFSVHPVLGFAAALVAPLMVVKLSYGMSMFRAVVVVIFYGMIGYVVRGYIERGTEAPAQTREARAQLNAIDEPLFAE